MGNPGKEYENNRHNLGFKVVDLLSENLKCHWRTGRGEFLIARGKLESFSFILVKPLTLMNRGGVAVKELVWDLDLELDRLLVILDDLNLPLGKIRHRAKGSDGGHRGLSSVIEKLQSQDFPRLRLGIGASPDGMDTAEYVLSDFRDDEADIVEAMIRRSAEAVKCFIKCGIEEAISRFNG